MPIELRADKKLEVASIHPYNPPRRPEIAGHRVRFGSVVFGTWRGLPIASPVDTWCMLSAIIPLDGLVAAGDFMLTGRRRIGVRGGGRQAPLAVKDELAEACSRHKGMAGAGLRRRALPLLRAGVDSPAETKVRLIVIGAGLPEPQVNCPVPVRGRVLHADLAYPHLKIAIEYEGRYHFVGGEEQARWDVERWELMHEAGWRVLRVTARDLRDPRGFLERLTRAMAERG